MPKSKKPSRPVYMSEITQDGEEHYTDAEEGYDIATPVDTIQTNYHSSARQANVTQRQPPAPNNNTRLPPDAWSQLSQDDRLMWMKLSRETKALILGLKNPPVPPRRVHNAPSNRKSMIHNISAFEFLNNIDDSFPIPQPTDMLTDPDATLLANATSLHDNHISPADIRKVLSTTNTSNPPQKPKPTPDSATVTIDGVKYRQCNTLLTYRVSEHKHKTNSSLIDRGANGGIAGNDVHCIAIYSDKIVNIMGIGNHKLSSIPLVTAGGVSQSQIGPVILIFNQYAHYGK
jgi:hypothetical protein